MAFYKYKNTKLGGFHTETINGETVRFYPKDDPVIESDNNLAASYPDKFQEVEAPDTTDAPKRATKKKTRA